MTLGLVIVCGMPVVVFAQVNMVSPADLTDAEGSFAFETRTGPYRTQWLYPAEDFADIPAGGAYIVATAVRADGGQSTEVSTSFGDIRVVLSTFPGGSLQSDFSANHGDDKTVVFDGSWNPSPFPVDGPPGGPNSFGTPITFETRFFYDPSLGDLLVEEASTSGSDMAGSLKDWEVTANTSIVWNWASKDAPVAQDSGGYLMVRQFTIIPEPSSALLLAFGLLGITALRRGRTGPPCP